MTRTSFVAGSLAALFALATGGPAIAAPNVVKVGLDHYRGTWLEIGRTPMFITDGCVAGYSTYQREGRPAISLSRMDAGSGHPKAV